MKNSGLRSPIKSEKSALTPRRSSRRSIKLWKASWGRARPPECATEPSPTTCGDHSPPLQTPRPMSFLADLTQAATRDVSGTMNEILADVFALYLKTKNFHWH